MRNILILLIASILSASTALAASPMKIYGIAHVSIDNISGSTNDLQVKSRSSRLGIKGDKTLKGDLQGFYKFEFQYDMADDNNGDNFIKSRNMYVGIKDYGLGTLLIGRHDSAMKKAIGIKIFSDTIAEMTSVMGKDVGLYNRTNNTIFYKSKNFGPIQIMASLSTFEGDTINKTSEMESYALTYKTKNLYIGLAKEKVDALDGVVKGQKGERFTLGYTFPSGSKIGVGYESGQYASGAQHKAYVVNGIRKLSELYKMKVTYGKRTAVKDETAFGIGLIRDLGDNSELYAIYHTNKDDNVPIFNEKVISLGMKYVF